MTKDGTTFNNEKEFLMFYHTSIRNVGLFTSVALAAISVGSVFGNAKSKYGFKQFYSVMIYLLALAFLLMAIQILRLFIDEIHRSEDHLEIKSIHEWLLIPYIALTVDLGLVMVAGGSFLSALIALINK